LSQTQGRPDDFERPDVELTADVKSRWLRFEKVPGTDVRFPGYPEEVSASGTDRENLPRKVEKDVLYRDSIIRLRSAAQIPVPPGRGGPGRGSDKG
jgi:hypothetical protein